MFDGWVTGHHWRTDGRKIFRPYTCGALLHWARTTVHGVATVDTRAIADGWRTDGRKMFRPHIHGALLNWAGATIYGAAMFDGWAIADGWRTDGRKMFRPYIHPSCSRPGARLMGAMGPCFLGSRKLSVSHCAGLLMM